MTITLPIPHKALSPNAASPGRWRAKAKHIRIHRQRAKLRTLEALGGQPAPAFTGYTLTFYHATKRNRDDDNAAASCKSYRDGIADALRMDDHKLTMSATPQMLIDPTNPRLEILLHV